MKVLVAEDDPTSREVLTSLLSKYGEISCAEDGDTALEMVTQALRDGAPFNLVCLDIMMPERDGHSVLRELRALESELKVPLESATRVIMTTALEDSSNVLNAFKVGCEAYVVKPIEKAKLVHEMSKLGLV